MVIDMNSIYAACTVTAFFLGGNLICWADGYTPGDTVKLLMVETAKKIIPGEVKELKTLLSNQKTTLQKTKNATINSGANIDTLAERGITIYRTKEDRQAMIDKLSDAIQNTQHRIDQLNDGSALPCPVIGKRPYSPGDWGSLYAPVHIEQVIDKKSALIKLDTLREGVDAQNIAQLDEDKLQVQKRFVRGLFTAQQRENAMDRLIARAIVTIINDDKPSDQDLYKLGNYSTDGFIDNRDIWIEGPIIFIDTDTYETAIGSSKTVPRAEPLNWESVVNFYNHQKH